MILLWNRSSLYVHTVRFVPAWFPGAGFKRKAIDWRQSTTALRDVPYEFAKYQSVRYSRNDPFTSSKLKIIISGDRLRRFIFNSKVR